MAKTQLNSAILNELLQYNADTGELLWKIRSEKWFGDHPKGGPVTQAAIWNTKYADKPAGSTMRNGYRRILIFGETLLSHRVIWCMQTGEWPKNEIDHINHKRDDNRWENLRDVSLVENRQNMSLQQRSFSGRTGVTWHKRDAKWRAYISENGRFINLGAFNTKDEAVDAREAAEHRLGYHPNHGS